MKSLKYILIPFVIIGFLWSCETTDPFVSDIETHMVLGSFDEAIAEADRVLETQPDNGVAHYYRGMAVASKAQTVDPPVDRKSYYEDSKGSFEKAEEFMAQRETPPEELNDINDLVTEFWAYEHNSAIEYLTEDSVRTSVDSPDQIAMDHLDNAITIQPDSALSFIVLSSTQFNTGDISSAISTYEEAMERLENPEIEDYEFLISLYIDQNRYEDAEPLTQEAIETHPDEDQFVQFLADIYIQMDNVDEAIAIIEDLIESDPDNPQYYRVLGTQIYQNVTAINNEISGLYDQVFELEQEVRSLSGSEAEEKEGELESIQAEVAELEAESEELTEISINQMKEVIRLAEDDDDAYSILGIIHQNRAASLFERRNAIVDDNELASELDELAREDLMAAMEYYEQAAEINPEEPVYWESLFQVYTTLGMEEEAREAMNKADQL
ncbi:MAG: tetratricopeptide repeat protein [Balneolaceae bacterium]